MWYLRKGLLAKIICTLMMRMASVPVALMATVLLTGCGLFDVHPYDGRTNCELQQNVRNMAKIEAKMRGRDTVRFAVISDTQRWFDEMEDEVESINRRGDIDFVIHCGDISDFGMTREYEWQTRVLQKLQMPYVVLLGNHDCIGSGKEVYREVFGMENFAFTAGFLRFVCLDTNALEYDFSSPVPNLTFMKGEAECTEDGVEATIVAMHVAPFADEFNNDVAEAFEYHIRGMKGTLCCIYGHGHTTMTSDLFGDGVPYHEVTCAKHRLYYVFMVTREGYAYETIDY